MILGAAYIRVSTEDQTEFSPDAQLRAIKEYAKRNDILLLDEFVFKDEGISGRKADKRPGFQLMISSAKKKPKPFDIILIHKYDRFARSREDSVVYKSLLRRECDIKVISITEQLEDDKFSIILESMLEAMAEYYSLNLAEEVKKGMFEKARRGENIGKPPYGYDLINSKLIPNESESEIVKLIFEMYKEESLTGVARFLNINGYPTRKNGSWTPHTLIYILQNPVYYGKTRYNYRKGGRRDLTNPQSDWILADSNHIPLISEEIFNATQTRLEQNSTLYGRNFSEKSLKSWLQHISHCEACGATLTVSSCDNQTYKMFRCSRHSMGKCQIGNTMSARKLESKVLNAIKRDYENPNGITLVHVKSNLDNNNLLTELEKKLKRVANKQELIKKAFLAEIDTLEEYKQNKELLKKEEMEIHTEINDLIKKQKNRDPKELKLGSFIQLLEDETQSIESKNKIAKQFIKDVCVDLKTKEMRIIYYI